MLTVIYAGGIFFSITTYLYSSKNTWGSQFLPVLKVQSIKMTNKQIKLKPYFDILLLWELVLIFPLLDFILACRYFSCYTNSLLNYLSYYFYIFPKFNYIFLIIHHFLSKKIYIFSSIKVFSTCTHFWKKHAWKSYVLVSFTKKYFISVSLNFINVFPIFKFTFRFFFFILICNFLHIFCLN